MQHDEYETVIGKLVLTKLYMVGSHRATIDAVIEEIESEYIERRNRNEI